MRGGFSRGVRHLAAGIGAAARAFPASVLDAIERRVTEGEKVHGGELRVAIEGSLSPLDAWRGKSPRERALELFAGLHVWDTEGDSGVLLYVLLADRAVEIVADRAAAARVPPERWNAVCEALVAAFAEGDYEAGTLAAVDRISALLAQAFPPAARNPDELPNRPALLR